jgi:predicted secreted acid phosphatase
MDSLNREENKIMNEKEKKLKKKAIVVDIDGTLFEEVPGWTLEKDAWWVEETLKMRELEVGIGLVKVFDEMGFSLVFLTARGQSCKKNTWIKFKEAGIDHLVDSMWHRPIKWNELPPVEYKRLMMRKIMSKYDVMYAMDDSDRNIAMFKDLGIKVFDAKKWWYENNSINNKGDK